MGVYSGVYEYTQQIQEQIPSIQSIRVFGAFAELQAGSLQYNRNFRTCRVHPARELLHKNGGSEPPAAWPGQSPNLPERHTLHWNLGK